METKIMLYIVSSISISINRFKAVKPILANFIVDTGVSIIFNDILFPLNSC
jgi:hypothetical protein